MSINIEKIKPLDPPYNPLGLEKVKNFLRITHSQDDSLIDDLACAAVEHLENETGQAIIQRRWQLICSNVSNSKIRLLVNPALSISEVKISEQNQVRLLNKSQYYLQGNTINLNAMVGSGALLEITYIAGYSSDFCPYKIDNYDGHPELEEKMEVMDKREVKRYTNPLSAQIKSVLLDMVNNMYDGKGCDAILNSEVVFQMRSCFL